MAAYKTSEYAAKLGCCDKTVLRAMFNDPAPSDWHDEKFDVAQVAKVFNSTSVAALTRVMRGEDDLLDSAQAASALGISLRRFHQKQAAGEGPPKAINHGRVVRYFQSDLSADI